MNNSLLLDGSKQLDVSLENHGEGSKGNSANSSFSGGSAFGDYSFHKASQAAYNNEMERKNQEEKKN